MSDYITLLGSEEVARAGGAMRDAASTMQRAADSMEESLQRQRVFLDDWLMRFEFALRDRMPVRSGATGGPA